MQNILSYEQIIFRNYLASIILGVFALIAAIVCAISQFRDKNFLNKTCRILIMLVLFALVIVIIALAISMFGDAYYYIHNKSYISVVGSFTVTEPFEVITNRSTESDTKEIKIIHADGTTEELVLRMNIVSILDGSYNGTFVYSERTKILLDWDAVAE